MIAVAERRDNIAVVAAGTAAAILAGLFVTFHLSIAILAGLLIFCLAAAENETFLLAIIFLVPVVCLRQVGPITDVMTPLRLLVIIGFFAGRFWRGNLGLRKHLSSPLSKAALAFLIVAPITVLAGPIGWGHHSMSQNYQLASWVGFFFFIVCWVNSRARLERVLVTLLLSLCAVGAFAIIQTAVGGYTRLWYLLAPPGPDSYPWTGRAGSFLGYPTELAGYLDLALPFALAAAAVCRGTLKKLGIAAFALGVAGLFCSQSLGGLITLAFTLGLAVWYFVRARRNRMILAGGLLLLGAAFFALRHVLNPGHFASSHMTMPVDVISRLIYFHAAWVLFSGHPLFGIGLGNFVVASPGLVPNVEWMQIGTGNLSASNLYLNFLAETGLVGMLVFLCLPVLGMRKALREFKANAYFLAPVFAFGALGAVWALMIHGCVDYLFYGPYGTYFFMVLGLLMATAGAGASRRGGAERATMPGGTTACG